MHQGNRSPLRPGFGGFWAVMADVSLPGLIGPFGRFRPLTKGAIVAASGVVCAALGRPFEQLLGTSQ